MAIYLDDLTLVELHRQSTTISRVRLLVTSRRFKVGKTLADQGKDIDLVLQLKPNCHNLYLVHIRNWRSSTIALNNTNSEDLHHEVDQMKLQAFFTAMLQHIKQLHSVKIAYSYRTLENGCQSLVNSLTASQMNKIHSLFLLDANSSAKWALLSHCASQLHKLSLYHHRNFNLAANVQASRAVTMENCAASLRSLTLTGFFEDRVAGYVQSLTQLRSLTILAWPRPYENSRTLPELLQHHDQLQKLTVDGSHYLDWMTTASGLTLLGRLRNFHLHFNQGYQSLKQAFKRMSEKRAQIIQTLAALSGDSVMTVTMVVGKQLVAVHEREYQWLQEEDIVTDFIEDAEDEAIATDVIEGSDEEDVITDVIEFWLQLSHTANRLIKVRFLPGDTAKQFMAVLVRSMDEILAQLIAQSFSEVGTIEKTAKGSFWIKRGNGRLLVLRPKNSDE